MQHLEILPFRYLPSPESGRAVAVLAPVCLVMRDGRLSYRRVQLALGVSIAKRRALGDLADTAHRV